MTGSLIIFIIKVYQKTLSPEHGVMKYIRQGRPGTCMYYPTCSEYMILSIKKYGTQKGFVKGLKRIWRCRPSQKGGVDMP